MATSAIDTEKWKTGIDATATDIKEVEAFIDWRLSIYKKKGWKRFDLWESFVDDFESFTRDILDNLGKDQLKKIRDYLCANGVYVRKEARKSIADGLLGVIHEPTPSKWPTDDPTDDPTPALPLLSTAPVQTTQPIATATATAITPPRTQTPTPTTPQPPAAPTPQQAAPSTQALLASPLPPTAELPLPTNVTTASNDFPPTAELPLPTNVTAVSNDLPTAKLPSPTNVAAPSTNVTAPPTNTTGPSTNVTAPPTYNPDTVCCLPCRSATSKITSIARPKRQRAPFPMAFASHKYYVNRVYILVVLHTKKELPVLEYIDGVYRLNDCAVTPAIRLNWHRTAIYHRQTDSAATPAITILIAPICLRSTDQMIVPICLRSIDRLIDKLSA